MKIGPIPDPFSGEKIASIYPRIASFVDQTPRLGRLNYFPGRHLTATALQMEQAVRTQRLALRARAVDAGVVSGLEVSWRTASGGVQFEIQPGQGITTDGVDVAIDHVVDAAFEDLWLFDIPTGQVGSLPIGLMDGGPSAAFAAVLLLQPGFVDDADLPLAVQTTDNGTDFTPCPRVPTDEVYYKTTSTDALRLVLYPLPWNEPPGALWQNRVAWSVFNVEAAGGTLPWLSQGVPIAMIGFNDGLVPEWIDRQAVARPAGRPRHTVLIQPGFDRRVWRARFDQFCAQLSQLTAPQASIQFARFLPPIGLLPKAYLTLTKQPANEATPATWNVLQSFFPSSYTIDISVVPLEQLDALIDDCVPLQPYDLTKIDAVRLLLPVSQQWFDPALLAIEVIDPQFDEQIATYRQARGDVLAQRYDLASRRHMLELSVDGNSTPYPLSESDVDLQRLENPEDPVSAPPGDDLQYGVQRTVIETVPNYTSDVMNQLRATAQTFLKTFTNEDIAEFQSLFASCGIDPTQTATAFSPDTPPAWLAGLTVAVANSPLEAGEQDELRRELLAYLKKQCAIQAQEAQKVASATLEDLIAFFTAEANEADELVDSGFLKARTDVFRLGTLLSNSSLATKFVASPSLANIIDRKPPKTDPVAVNAFASQLLADFAPSAIGSGGSPATNPTPGNTAPLAGGMKVRSLSLSTGGLVGGVSLGGIPQETWTNLGQAGDGLVASRDAVQSLSSKLLGANSPLTAAEQDAFKQFTSSAQAFASADTVSLLQRAAQVGTFADTYVANFNDLSQRQIRAIPLDRLQPALAPTIRQEIHDGRLEIFERLTRLNLSLADLTTDFVDAPGTPVRPQLPTFVTRLRFQTLISRRRFDTIATIQQTSDTTGQVNDADESQHFSSGVSYADMAMAALRAVEARVKDYRAFISACQTALDQTKTFIDQITTALKSVEIDLEAARQDVAVALALKAEEQARLDQINAHREKVLNDHVQLVVFHRPRAIALNVDVPIRPIEPALMTDPIIDCLLENPSPPSDLGALRDIFRASPARWFKYAPQWIEKVDHWDHLRIMLERSVSVAIPALDQTPFVSSGRYTQPLTLLYQARQAAAKKYVAAAQNINVATLSSLSWVDLQQQARQQLTLDHLITAGPAPLAKAAAEELEHLFVVATCLHQNFSAVPGLVRLDWAERFGQFDQVAIDFRDLSRLPAWNRIEFTLRREMQLHTDWLFSRIDVNEPEAIALINDLIRVALLLASHAPVDQLIVGHPVDTEITPRPGTLIKVITDPIRIRRGMDVVCNISPTQMVRAVVEDISATNVAARITDVPAANGTPIKLTSASTFYFR